VISVFADTSFYVVVVNREDAAHHVAREFALRFHGIMLTTEYVLVEVGNWLSRSGDRSVFLDLMARLMSDAHTVIVPADHNLFERGLALYAERPDKDWSLTDCIWFIVMQEREVMEALTADRHFEQAGFVALLR
jgi:predicted nucleic acid-binding protein